MAPLLCSAWTDSGNVVHEPSRNKESPSLLRIESLPISAFIRSRFGLKRPIKFTEQGVHWLLAASRFQSGKNAGCLAVGPPRTADTRGQHMRWWAKPQQLGWGAIADLQRNLGNPPSLLLSALHTPFPGLPPQCSAGPQLQGQVQVGGSGGDPAADGLGLVPDKGLATPRPN